MAHLVGCNSSLINSKRKISCRDGDHWYLTEMKTWTFTSALHKTENMSINTHSLADDFKDRAEYSSVEFKDEEGNWQTEQETTFDSISTALQNRGHISKEELMEIARWKVQGGRLDRHIEKNTAEKVREQSGAAFDAKDDEKRISALSELTGVRAPVASSILAMWKPERHAVIDFRAFRALPAAKPSLLNRDSYEDLAEFLELFRTYGSNLEAYAFYVEEVRELAEHHDLLTREVDMALWEFDRQRTEA